MGSSDPSDHNNSPREPIDYEAAVREILNRRRKRRFSSLFRSLPDPRPSSPGPVMLVGLAVLLVGALLPVLHPLLMVGLALLVVGFLSGLIQPRARTVTWRGRRIDLPPEPSWYHRVYWILYRQPKGKPFRQ